MNSKKVFATLGPEQEYFLIDQDYYYKRQDLVLSGRTLLEQHRPRASSLKTSTSAASRKGSCHSCTMLKRSSISSAYPAKTRHNEVAPSQFEIAPIFEEANLAADHNQLVMDTMKRVATTHKLRLLLHEKPFAGINGSGKHVNWSLSDDHGQQHAQSGQDSSRQHTVPGVPHGHHQGRLIPMPIMLRASVASARQ
ncbi:MAG: hypothetical protein MZU95_00060 [Desulfomicrobium escambiense]|nr:hypothetical protein [Desulfomicrobium escambiense]